MQLSVVRQGTAQPGAAADRFAHKIAAILECDTMRVRRLSANPFGGSHQFLLKFRTLYCALPHPQPVIESHSLRFTPVIEGAKANHMRVTLEIGPKGKKVVAVAPDWPGLARGAATEQAALERLRSYIPRYSAVTKLAGMKAAFTTITDVDVVEHYPGTGSTDFWGISFAFSSIDKQAISGEALERELTLMQACWAFFDDVRSRVSAEMQKGPRGGGRDRDRIVAHIFANEQEWAKGLGVHTADGAMLTDEGLKAHRDAYCHAIRDYHAQGKLAGKWPLRYLIRHTAFHTMDHAWEMEDKDLTGKRSERYTSSE